MSVKADAGWIERVPNGTGRLSRASTGTEYSENSSSAESAFAHSQTASSFHWSNEPLPPHASARIASAASNGINNALYAISNRASPHAGSATQSQLIATALEASFAPLSDPSKVNSNTTFHSPSTSKGQPPRRLTKFRSLFDLRSKSTETEFATPESPTIFEKLFPKRFKSMALSSASESDSTGNDDKSLNSPASASRLSPMSTLSVVSPLSSNRRSKSPGTVPIMRRRQLGVSVSIVEDPSPVDNSDAISIHSTTGTSWKHRPPLRRAVSHVSLFGGSNSRARMDQQQKEILEEAWSSLNQEALLAQALYSATSASLHPRVADARNVIHTPPTSPAREQTRSLAVTQHGPIPSQFTDTLVPPIPAIPNKWLKNAPSPLNLPFPGASTDSSKLQGDWGSFHNPLTSSKAQPSSSGMIASLGEPSTSVVLRRVKSFSDAKGGSKRGAMRSLVIDTTSHRTDLADPAAKQKNESSHLSRLYPGL
ncbi:hypothetical protein HDU80_003717 [Chytriomyces hyalinus]|nr:hypothetical protein HDU80_003717 [Chytriomyces hyalinus]